MNPNFDYRYTTPSEGWKTLTRPHKASKRLLVWLYIVAALVVALIAGV